MFWFGVETWFCYTAQAPLIPIFWTPTVKPMDNGGNGGEAGGEVPDIDHVEVSLAGHQCHILRRPW